MWPSLTVLDGKKRERLGPLEKRNQSGKKTISQPLLEKQKKQKQEKQEEEEEEDMEEETVCAETPHRGEVQEEYQMQTKMTVSLVADRDQPVAKATSGTRKEEQRVSEDSADKQDKRCPVGRAKDSSATLGKRKGKCDVEEAVVPRKKKQKTVHESDVMQNAPSATSSVAATDSPGPLSASVSGAGLLAAEQQSLKRGLKGSLKDMTKGRSGVVAVKDIRRKQKGRRSGGWDPAGLSSGATVFQIGSGQMSTWT